MRPRFRIILLLTLCLALLSSGCSLLEKQKLPFQRQDEVTIWANGIAGLPGVEQGRRAEMVWKNPSSSQALKLPPRQAGLSRPQGTGRTVCQGRARTARRMGNHVLDRP